MYLELKYQSSYCDAPERLAILAVFSSLRSSCTWLQSVAFLPEVRHIVPKAKDACVGLVKLAVVAAAQFARDAKQVLHTLQGPGRQLPKGVHTSVPILHVHSWLGSADRSQKSPCALAQSLSAAHFPLGMTAATRAAA
jgi:hypothetical protein